MEDNVTKIQFTEDAVMDYLDGCIKVWRSRKNDACFGGDDNGVLVTSCYIDAYQSVRVSLFGKKLSE